MRCVIIGLVISLSLAANASLVVNYNFNGNYLDSSGNEFHGIPVGASMAFGGSSPHELVFNNPLLTPVTGYVMVPNGVGARIASSSFTVMIQARRWNNSIHGGRVFGTVLPSRLTFVSHQQRFGRSYWQIGGTANYSEFLFDDRMPVVTAEHAWFATTYERSAGSWKVFHGSSFIAEMGVPNLPSFDFTGGFTIGAILGDMGAHGANSTAVGHLAIFDRALSPAEIGDFQSDPIPEPSSLAVGLGVLAVASKCVKSQHKARRKA